MQWEIKWDVWEIKCNKQTLFAKRKQNFSFYKKFACRNLHTAYFFHSFSFHFHRECYWHSMVVVKIKRTKLRKWKWKTHQTASPSTLSWWKRQHTLLWDWGEVGVTRQCRDTSCSVQIWFLTCTFHRWRSWFSVPLQHEILQEFVWQVWQGCKQCHGLFEKIQRTSATKCRDNTLQSSTQNTLCVQKRRERNVKVFIFIQR